MTQEEKAKAYDEAKARMHRAYDSNRCTIGFMNEIFPELKESEDERIRKGIIRYVKGNMPDNDFRKKYIAWLEKQGEQRSIYKIEPKFKVGDIIRHKKQGFTCKIIAIDTEYRLSECNGTHLPFDSQDAYELVEQKPTNNQFTPEEASVLDKHIDKFLEQKSAWSERDIGMYVKIKACLRNTNKDYSAELNWLKSLKDRVQLMSLL